MSVFTSTGRAVVPLSSFVPAPSQPPADRPVPPGTSICAEVYAIHTHHAFKAQRLRDTMSRLYGPPRDPDPVLKALRGTPLPRVKVHFMVTRVGFTQQMSLLIPYESLCVTTLVRLTGQPNHRINHGLTRAPRSGTSPPVTSPLGPVKTTTRSTITHAHQCGMVHQHHQFNNTNRMALQVS